MTIIDTGTYGAKRQSTRKASPRDTLLRLMEAHPSSDEQDLRTKFTSKVVDDPDQIDAIIEYWFANNYRSLVHQRRSAAQPAAEKKKEQAARAARVETIKAEIKVRATRMVLLDMTMPNGKLLRECTGKDCAKAGGWLSKIAKAIKPTDVVGKVMSETQVRKFFK